MAKKPKLSDENQRLVFFLIKLAISKRARQAFEADPQKAMEKAKLSPESKKAISRGNEAKLAKLASLQSTGGGAPADATESVKKTVAQKGAEKKAPKKK
jgi:hypothetical protein